MVIESVVFGQMEEVGDEVEEKTLAQVETKNLVNNA